jgi:hypothetical protein
MDACSGLAEIHIARTMHRIRDAGRGGREIDTADGALPPVAICRFSCGTAMMGGVSAAVAMAAVLGVANRLSAENAGAVNDLSHPVMLGPAIANVKLARPPLGRGT